MTIWQEYLKDSGIQIPKLGYTARKKQELILSLGHLSHFWLQSWISTFCIPHSPIKAFSFTTTYHVTILT